MSCRWLNWVQFRLRSVWVIDSTGNSITSKFFTSISKPSKAGRHNAFLWYSFVVKIFYCVLSCSGKDWLAVDHDDEMEAAWLYVQYLFGVPHDDCDYDKILLQLSAELKAYIKLLVCFPNRIFEKEFVHISEAVCGPDLVCVRYMCVVFVYISRAHSFPQKKTDVGLAIKRSWVRFSVGPLSSYLGQLSLSSLRGR